jgi:hypothetical protein
VFSRHWRQKQFETVCVALRHIIPSVVYADNVQIEGLADYKTRPEPRKFKTAGRERTIIGQSLSNAGLGRKNSKIL